MYSDNLKYALGGYFKAQFKIMGVVFLILAAGLGFMGIGYFVLVAFLISFLDFLPFFGTGTAMIPWAVYQFFMGDYKMTVYFGRPLCDHTGCKTAPSAENGWRQCRTESACYPAAFVCRL